MSARPNAAELDRRLSRLEDLLAAVVVSAVGGVSMSELAPVAARQRARAGAAEILREREREAPYETREGATL